MNLVLLFNSNHKSLKGNYSFAVMRKIFSTQVLQNSNRSLRVSMGDVLTYGAASRAGSSTGLDRFLLCQKVYRPQRFDRLKRKQLEDTFLTAVVFCWCIHNATAKLGTELHSHLLSDRSYLGAMDVTFDTELSLYFFRNSLPEEFRIKGRLCSVYYPLGVNEDPDVAVRQILETHGFDVEYEDSGARRTIFDKYYSIDHFKRLEDFKRIFAQLPNLDEDFTSDLALFLEELHPRLFDVLASAARTLSRSETNEDFAQVALSGRRFLEALADNIFPPSDEQWRGRSVSADKYKNRILAYIEQTLENTNQTGTGLLENLGKEAGRLITLFNVGLHNNPVRENIESAFADMARWLLALIELSPESARKPYLPYNDSIDDFMKEVISGMIETRRQKQRSPK